MENDEQFYGDGSHFVHTARLTDSRLDALPSNARSRAMRVFRPRSGHPSCDHADSSLTWAAQITEALRRSGDHLEAHGVVRIEVARAFCLRACCMVVAISGCSPSLDQKREENHGHPDRPSAQQSFRSATS